MIFQDYSNIVSIQDLICILDIYPQYSHVVPLSAYQLTYFNNVFILI
jgi:hypothetical protein